MLFDLPPYLHGIFIMINECNFLDKRVLVHFVLEKHISPCVAPSSIFAACVGFTPVSHCTSWKFVHGH